MQLTREFAVTLTHARRFVVPDGYAIAAVVIGLLAVGRWATAPAPAEEPLLRAAVPLLSTLMAVGTLRVSRDRRLDQASVRFWRVFSAGLFAFAAGGLVELTGDRRLEGSGELLFFSLAGAIVLWGLTTYQTMTQTPARRLTQALDVATLLVGSAAYLWYLVASKRWHPDEGLAGLGDGLVLPAAALVAGFVVIRIRLSGSPVMSRFTTGCVVFAAVGAATGLFLGPGTGTTSGRIASIVYVLALTAFVVGVSAQRRTGPSPGRVHEARLSQLFVLLPYGAIVTAVTLLAVALQDGLDDRDRVVLAAVIVLCAVVLVRQAMALVENTRLLRVNRQLTGRLGRLAYSDELTGLANRARFTQRVGEALKRPAGGATVLFVDLDDFKVINDGLGHHAGDQLLRAVAGRLRYAVGDTCTLGRLGGDEFGLLVDGPPDGQGPEIADRVRTALHQPLRINGVPVRVGASVGIATATTGGLGTMELLRNADVAMYAAKGSDKGRSRVFEPGMLTDLQDRHQLQAALVQAIERDELEVNYQPIVNLDDGSLRGAEALVRWRAADGSLVQPDRFIGLAEETGLITEIDRRVLSRACAEVAQWPGAVALHVNVSARELHEGDLVEDVATVLSLAGLPPDRLTLEITETALRGDPEAAMGRMAALATVGVHLAIDDFGTGYSSLAYLRRMPVDTLKIDKTFVDELTTTESAPLVEAVTALAQTLGMQTVAEGIEQTCQVRRLLALGCRYGQGYHFAGPLPAEDMAALVQRTWVPASALDR